MEFLVSVADLRCYSLLNCPGQESPQGFASPRFPGTVRLILAGAVQPFGCSCQACLDLSQALVRDVERGFDSLEHSGRARGHRALHDPNADAPSETEEQPCRTEEED